MDQVQRPVNWAQGFRIVLDNPKEGPYTSGDTISGHVVLGVHDNIDIGNVQIQLWGRSKTKLVHSSRHGGQQSGGRRSYTYRGRGCLFCKTTTLYQGRYTHKDPYFAWPFEFTFPAVAEKTPFGDQFTDSGLHYKDSSQHASIRLPSTFEKSGRSPSYKYECYVEYKLDAKLYKPGKVDPEMERELVMPFVQIPSISTELDLSSRTERRQDFIARTYSLDPSYDRPLTFKEKSKSFFGSRSLPTAQFEIVFYGPKNIVLRQPTSLFFELKHTRQSATVPAPPSVTLNSVRVSITESTHMRSSPGIFGDHEYTDKSDRGMIHPMRPWDRGPFTKETAYQKELCLEAISPMRLAPSFSTYNICRRYRMKVQGIVECAGERMDLFYEMFVEIVGGPMQQRAAQQPSSSGDIYACEPSSSTIDGAEADPQLPLYEEASNSGSRVPQTMVPDLPPAFEARV